MLSHRAPCTVHRRLWILLNDVSLDIENGEDERWRRPRALAYLQPPDMKLIKPLVKIYEPSWETARHANALRRALQLCKFATVVGSGWVISTTRRYKLSDCLSASEGSYSEISREKNGISYVAINGRWKSRSAYSRGAVVRWKVKIKGITSRSTNQQNGVLESRVERLEKSLVCSLLQRETE